MFDLFLFFEIKIYKAVNKYQVVMFVLLLIVFGQWALF